MVPLSLTQEHLVALDEGRRMGRVVRRYLTAVAQRPAPRRGPQRTVESVSARLDKAVAERDDPQSDVLVRLKAAQRAVDLQSEVKGLSAADTAEAEEQFVQVAAEYSERKGITWRAWREVGVPADVLRRAGVPRDKARVG